MTRYVTTTRQQIENWLEHYNELVNDYCSARLDRLTPRDPLPYTKAIFTDGRLKKLIIDEAISEMPDFLGEPLKLRYIDTEPIKFILSKLGICKDTYYSRVTQGITYIFYHSNNMTLDKMRMKERIRKLTQKRDNILKKLKNT